MSEKHLSTGSLCPPQDPSLLRCYSMKYCPYAERTRLILTSKGVKHDIVNINLATKPEWFFQKNPLGKVPALELHGDVLFESLVTCDYLDELYPSPVLYPSDPWKKAQDRILIELFNKVSSAMYKVYPNLKDIDALNNAIGTIQDGLDVFEKEIVKRGTKFFFGEDCPGMVDYMIWPWIERLPMVQNLFSHTKIITNERYPNLINYIEAMMSDETIKTICISPEEHTKFMQFRLEGNFIFDFTME